MQIVHSPHLGTIVHQEMKDPSLPYAIFVNDGHTSHTAQQNIARLYEHYARNNGLVLVGAEGLVDGHYIPSNPSAVTELEKQAGRKLTPTFQKTINRSFC